MARLQARHEGIRKSEGTAPLINFGIYGCEESASRPSPYISGERALSTHLIDGWVGNIACTGAFEEIDLLSQPRIEQQF